MSVDIAIRCEYIWSQCVDTAQHAVVEEVSDMSFGAVLRSARTKKKLSLRRLSVMVRYPHSLLSEIEHGRRLMPDNTALLCSLVEALDLNVEVVKRLIEQDRLLANPSKLFNHLMSDKQLAALIETAIDKLELEKIGFLIRCALEEGLKGEMNPCNA